MKRVYWIAALLPLAAWCAAAQVNVFDEAKANLDKLEKLIAESKVMGPEGGLFNPAVTGAPYSADEVTQFSQTLGDGTHIQRETKVAVYRDAQGRVRRETLTEIIVADPVAHVSYALDPKTKTARRMGVMLAAERAAAEAREAGLQRSMAMEAKMREDAQAQAEVAALSTYTIGGRGLVTFGRRTAGEPIGQQLVEGVLCDGTRSVETIAAGSIGNDRPIQTVYERWYSSELKTTVRTVRSDPRTGEETFRLTNIRRGEPSPELFQVPPGYKIVGN